MKRLSRYHRRREIQIDPPTSQEWSELGKRRGQFIVASLLWISNVLVWSYILLSDVRVW